LIAGERDPAVLADMARTRMRPKIGELHEALVGRFDEHHAVMARMHLDHVDQRTGIMDRLDAEVDRLMAPFAESATRVMSVPGIAKRSAEVVVSKIGNDMSASRPRSPLLPGPVSVPVMTSPGASVDPAGPARATPRSRRRCARPPGPPHTPATPICRRNTDDSNADSAPKSEGKAILASAHTMIVIVWHILASENTTYQELGADYFERRNDAAARQRYTRPRTRTSRQPSHARARRLRPEFRLRRRPAPPRIEARFGDLQHATAHLNRVLLGDHHDIASKRLWGHRPLELVGRFAGCTPSRRVALIRLAHQTCTTLRPHRCHLQRTARSR
jgi:hypothetical protein